ncbi:hypothetical protein, partial [Klebsiella pneumoniae]
METTFFSINAFVNSGSVVVDIAIDQGGIFETTDRITT